MNKQKIILIYFFHLKCFFLTFSFNITKEEGEEVMVLYHFISEGNDAKSLRTTPLEAKPPRSVTSINAV